MQPYYQAGGIILYHARAEDVLPGLDAESVDMVLTDPPFGISGRQEENAIEVNGHAPFKRDFGDWDQEWDPRWLLSEADRLLRKGGSLIAFMAHEWVAAWSYTPLEERKFGVWVKTNPAPRVRPGYQHGTEFWTWQVKPGASPTWNGGFTQNNAIITPNALSCEGVLVHPTQKPLRLIRGFVLRHSNEGDIVADPYAGSGTTLVAAKQLGRKAIGIEVNQDYCELAAQRLEKVEQNPPMPGFAELCEQGTLDL